VLASLTIALSCVGCGSSSTTQDEQDQRAEEYARSLGVDVDVKTNADGTRSVTVENGPGGGVTAQAGSNLSAPAGFPEDVPIYPQLDIAASSAMPNMGFSLQGHTADAVEKVMEYYGSELPARGWKANASQRSPMMSLMEFSKGSRVVTISLLPTNGGATVQITTMTAG
jgi:hypothetical protein